jgi:hypothetical protein
MLTIVVFLAMMTSAPPGGAPHWLRDMQASPRAMMVVSQPAQKKAKIPRTTSASPPNPGGRSVSRSDGFAEAGAYTNDGPAYRERIGTVYEALGIVADLLDSCRYADAYASISAFRREHPDAADLTDHVAVDCANLVGRHAEAYNTILPWAIHEGDKSPHHLLALSLASAALGEVFEGQAQYCWDKAMEGLKQENIVEGLDRKLARRNDAKGVAILSCLALGLKYRSSPYLEMALRLDPTNTVAGNELISRYQLRGRNTDAKRVASGILKNLPADHPRRADFERRLAESE